MIVFGARKRRVGTVRGKECSIDILSSDNLQRKTDSYICSCRKNYAVSTQWSLYLTLFPGTYKDLLGINTNHDRFISGERLFPERGEGRYSKRSLVYTAYETERTRPNNLFTGLGLGSDNQRLRICAKLYTPFHTMNEEAASCEHRVPACGTRMNVLENCHWYVRPLNHTKPPAALRRAGVIGFLQ